MSVHVIYYKDGAKVMRPILTREEYLALRGTEKQKAILKAVREGDERQKHRLLQMNYSCLPNEDGTLKGSTRMSTSVGMDIDHVTAEEMVPTKERILAKKNELGLLMLEVSARKQGYHLVFRRHPELSQEENLRWASELLGVAFDDKAKDITRVFFTTSDAEEDLLFLDDGIFEEGKVESVKGKEESVKRNCKADEPLENKVESVAALTSSKLQALGRAEASSDSVAVAALQCCSSKTTYTPDARYNGMLFKDIIAKYWELYNEGKRPSEGDRNVLTFELAVTIRSICGYSLEKLLAVVPNYWAKADGTCSQDDSAEWRKTIENALKEPRKGMPYRGVADSEIADWRKGLRRYADYASADAKETASANQVADEERTLVLQACCG